MNDVVTVRVYPSLHSCIWTTNSWDAGEAVLGDYGLTEDERWRPGRRGFLSTDADEEQVRRMREHREECAGSNETRGALAYAIETPEGSIFYHDTSGCWTRVVSDLRPDVAIVAMAGRPNVDGEPIQGSLAQFVGRMAGMLRPRQMFLGHHDDWMPPLTHDMSDEESLMPVRKEMELVVPRTELISVGYLEGTKLFV